MSINHDEKKHEEIRLQRVLQCIRKQLEEKLQTSQKCRNDIIATNKFMWEDIGNVPYDLLSAVQTKQYLDDIKRQAISQQLYNTQAQKLEKLYSSPYFGRVDFLENGEHNPEQVYIGISSLVDENTDEYLIYDWRAPVSSIFYDYETGKAKYNCPSGNIHGTISLKRQYKISDRCIIYMFDSNVKIDDEMLQELLSKSVDDKMKTIVTSIQREQNKIIRDDEHRLLIVQGPAGSGKTSIALHRVAYLIYRHRNFITAKNIMIFSPNQIFNDYISNVLPELGEENMYQTTFMEYMKSSLCNSVKVEDMNDLMEYLLSCRSLTDYNTRVKCIMYKCSNAFASVLKNYVHYLDTEGITFDDVVYLDTIIISKNEMLELYHKDYAFLPIVKRLEKIRHRILYLIEPFRKERTLQIQKILAEEKEYVVEGKIKARSILFARAELEPLKEKIENMTYCDAFELYRRLFEDKKLFIKIAGEADIPQDFNEICTFTLKNLGMKNIGYEDAAPLLFFNGALGYLPNTSGIKHVIIDEAQDYTPIHYEIFKQLFPHSNFTLLGDLNQSINPYMNIGNYENITTIFNCGSATMIQLSKSYRSTVEIAEFSSRILDNRYTTTHINRHGDTPLIHEAADIESLTEAIAEDIKSLKENGSHSIAIVCKTAHESQKVYEVLKNKDDVKLMTKDDEEFGRGTVVIPSYLAKGLEFDAVIIFNASVENYCHKDESKLLYTACTRALHHLHVYFIGKISPLLVSWN